jgi:hypothetical protein
LRVRLPEIEGFPEDLLDSPHFNGVNHAVCYGLPEQN